MEDRMKVKDYEVKGSSAKEVLEGNHGRTYKC